MNSPFPLYVATRRRDHDEIRRRIKAGDDVEQKSPGGRTALYVAAEEGDPQAATLLIAAGADVDARTKYGRTPLHAAAGLGAANDLADEDRDRRREAWPFARALPQEVLAALVRLLQKHDPALAHLRPDASPAREQTMVVLGALMEWMQTRESRRDLLDALKTENVDPEMLPPDLHRRLTCGEGHDEVIRLLHARGADLDAVDERGESALLIAVESGDRTSAELLLDLGAGLHAVGDDPENFTTPLGEAISRGRTELAILLMDRGADLELGNDYRTPLHLAAENHHLDLVVELLERGVEVDIRDNSGQTPLFLATMTGALDVMRELLRRGADTAAVNVADSTLLHAAALSWRPETAEILLAAGTDPSIPDRYGDTPLEAFRNDLDDVDPSQENVQRMLRLLAF